MRALCRGVCFLSRRSRKTGGRGCWGVSAVVDLDANSWEARVRLRGKFVRSFGQRNWVRSLQIFVKYEDSYETVGQRAG